LKQNIRRLPLNALRVFVVAARERSFAAAAEQLNVSAAAVSSQVKVLENFVRAPLFKRGPRYVTLSANGEALLGVVERSLTELMGALERARTRHDEEPLVITVLSAFLERWLVPRIADFHARHPEALLRIQTGKSVVDLTANVDVDVAIRFGPGHWEGVVARRVLAEWLIPACTPEFADRLAGKSVEQALRTAPLVACTTEPWSHWASLVGRPDLDCRRATEFDTSLAVNEAVVHGGGLGLVRWSYSRDDFAAGRLVAPIGHAVQDRFAYYLVATESRFGSAKVCRFLDWITAVGKEWPDPPAEWQLVPGPRTSSGARRIPE
jgi:DNA-binding transcriptional LysR family regulator